MRHVKLTVREWEETGELGFVPNIFRGWDSYRPSRGLSHDLLEHTTKETGEVWQEYRALGGWMYVRDFTRNTPMGMTYTLLEALKRTGELISSDLFQINSDANEFGVEEDIPYIAPRKFSEGIEDKLKVVFRAFRDTAKEMWDIESGNEEGDEFYVECPYIDKLDLIENWIREGYFQARRRFKGEYVYHVFEAINREGENFFKNNEVFEGEQVTLSYNLDGHCRITRRGDYY